MKNIFLDYQGYWREVNKNGIPNASGVYCVYACTYNPSEETVLLRELIYIGESENVRERLVEYERLSDWIKRLKFGETLCYSFAQVGSSDRNCAEAAMIYHHKPPCNIEYKYTFPFPDTTIKTSGRNALLDTTFTVFGTR